MTGKTEDTSAAAPARCNEVTTARTCLLRDRERERGKGERAYRPNPRGRTLGQGHEATAERG